MSFSDKRLVQTDLFCCRIRAQCTKPHVLISRREVYFVFCCLSTRESEPTENMNLFLWYNSGNENENSYENAARYDFYTQRDFNRYAERHTILKMAESSQSLTLKIVFPLNIDWNISIACLINTFWWIASITGKRKRANSYVMYLFILTEWIARLAAIHFDTWFAMNQSMSNGLVFFAKIFFRFSWWTTIAYISGTFCRFS